MTNVKSLRRERGPLSRHSDDGSNSSLESLGALASEIGKMSKYEDVTGSYDASDSSGGKKGSTISESLPQSQSDPVSSGSVAKTTPDS
ncbi:hypothetical protein QE152_g1946 [Popillia japonica]|uniref:Uncharacterized protein n=1 Tax=Popillia japonica TaxID=7064 RepID=A0AAW1N4I8_POPJA